MTSVPFVLSPHVQRAIARMRQEAAFLADADRCGGKCYIAARAFCAALRAEGGEGTVMEFPENEGYFHQVAALGAEDEIDKSTLIVDWTARQFDAQAEWPRIESLQTAMERWGRAQTVDGANQAFLQSKDRSDFANDWDWPQALKQLQQAARRSEELTPTSSTDPGADFT